MTQEEIQYIEWTMHDLRSLISELRGWCFAHLPKKPEITGRINDLRYFYNRVEEILIEEIYKETNNEINGH